jgi:hypothetical protein
MTPDHQFVVTGVESLDKTCKKHIDPSNPPTITIRGECFHPLTRKILFSSSNHKNGTFPALEACTGWFRD